MFEQVVCAATNLPCVIENAKAAYVQTTVCFIGRCLPGLPYLAVKLFAARVSARGVPGHWERRERGTQAL